LTWYYRRSERSWNVGKNSRSKRGINPLRPTSLRWYEINFRESRVRCTAH